MRYTDRASRRIFWIFVALLSGCALNHEERFSESARNLPLRDVHDLMASFTVQFPRDVMEAQRFYLDDSSASPLAAALPWAPRAERLNIYRIDRGVCDLQSPCFSFRSSQTSLFVHTAPLVGDLDLRYLGEPLITQNFEGREVSTQNSLTETWFHQRVGVFQPSDRPPVPNLVLRSLRTLLTPAQWQTFSARSESLTDLGRLGISLHLRVGLKVGWRRSFALRASPSWDAHNSESPWAVSVRNELTANSQPYRQKTAHMEECFSSRNDLEAFLSRQSPHRDRPFYGPSGSSLSPIEGGQCLFAVEEPVVVGCRLASPVATSTGQPKTALESLCHSVPSHNGVDTGWSVGPCDHIGSYEGFERWAQNDLGAFSHALEWELRSTNQVSQLASRDLEFLTGTQTPWTPTPGAHHIAFGRPLSLWAAHRELDAQYTLRDLVLGRQDRADLVGTYRRAYQMAQLPARLYAPQATPEHPGPRLEIPEGSTEKLQLGLDSLIVPAPPPGKTTLVLHLECDESIDPQTPVLGDFD